MEHTQDEYALKVVFSAFTPAVKLAVHLNSPLDATRDLMTLAMWREAKQKYVTNNLISLIFGKSIRTVKYLSARYNKGNIFADTEISLMRRVEDLLRARPLSAAELSRRLPQCGEFDTARLAIKALLREQRVEAVPSAGKGDPVRFKVKGGHHQMVPNPSASDQEARIDALTEHMEAVAETVRRRFLTDRPEAAAARTFTFQAREDDMAVFREELFAFIRSRYMEMEARAAADPDAPVFSVYAGATIAPPQRMARGDEEGE